MEIDEVDLKLKQKKKSNKWRKKSIENCFFDILPLINHKILDKRDIHNR